MRVTIFSLLMLCAVSCFSQQWHTTIQLRRKAPMQLSDTTRHILLVNNTPAQPADFGHLNYTDVGQQVIEDHIALDISQAPVHALFGANETLTDAQWFDQVTIIDKSQCPKGQPFAKTPLTEKQVDSLCYRYDANAMLCLNQLLARDIVEMSCPDYLCDVSLSVYVVSSWSVHYPNNAKSFSYSQADTLIWDRSGYSLQDALKKLPNRETAILDMSMYVGQKVAELFAPHWVTVDRYYYSNKNQNILNGITALQHCRWEEARRQWLEAAEKEGSKRSDRTTRAYAMANLAALEEMQGNQQTAIQWAQKAAEAFSKIGSADGAQQQVNMLYYIEQLQE